MAGTTSSAENPETELAQRVRDFPDRLSPILVKELRQGMRTHLFTISFVVLQSLLLLCLMAGIAEPSSPVSSGFLWFFITTTLLVIQPLRGFNALSSETQLNTLDLIQMTPLDGWRITFGKWLALNAQGLLFVTAVLPYLAIRYFFGGVQFLEDLYILGSIALGSGLATAITIGFSVFRSVILRGAIFIGVGLFSLIIFNLLQSSIFGPFARSVRYDLGGLFSFAALFGIYFFLAFGASRIAPLSENHATRKRLVAIGFVLLCLPFAALGLEQEVLGVIATILIIVTIDALTEPVPVYAQVLIPFSKNPLTRIAATFLSPGWLGGIGFFVFCCILFFAIGTGMERISGLPFIRNREDLVAYLSAANTVIFPVALIHLFLGRFATLQFTFGLYLMIQAILLLVTFMIATIASAISVWQSFAFLAIPIPSVLLAATEGTDAGTPLYLGIAIATFVLCIALPLVRQPGVVREFLRQLKPSE